ncbi:hypothetical protein VV01_21595 [Luteipulveratus halotolerans]|uniref:Uncharacterized protein n=1 Tax=Luteipulveratus halotolerans TaxID=1631356 RepID=A0A0L6CDV5_9MICO|nr:hypothetical protein VV01_21595 [Luteipulveratus halotolerans]
MSAIALLIAGCGEDDAGSVGSEPKRAATSKAAAAPGATDCVQSTGPGPDIVAEQDGDDLYTSGLAYGSKPTTTVWEYNRPDSVMFKSAASLPAGERVCYDLSQAVESQRGGGSGEFAFVPIRWAAHPDKELYVMFGMEDGADEDFCPPVVDWATTTYGCKGDKNSMQLDLMATQKLPKGATGVTGGGGD